MFVCEYENYECVNVCAFVFSASPGQLPLVTNPRGAQVCRNKLMSEAPSGGCRRGNWEVLPAFLPMWEQEHKEKVGKMEPVS